MGTRIDSKASPVYYLGLLNFQVIEVLSETRSVLELKRSIPEQMFYSEGQTYP